MLEPARESTQIVRKLGGAVAALVVVCSGAGGELVGLCFVPRYPILPLRKAGETGTPPDIQLVSYGDPRPL